MNIMLANNTGNVGKSTLADYLLAPRIPNSAIITVESNNDSGDNDSAKEKLSGAEFNKIFDRIFDEAHENKIVDVGSSNIETFIKIINTEYEGALEFFDYIIIPTVPSIKEMKDTVATYIMFISMGFPKEKIRFIFNMTDPTKTIEEQFASVIVPCKIKLSNVAIINDVKIFKNLAEKGLTYRDIALDNRDFDAELSKADAVGKVELRKAKLMRMAYNTFSNQLDLAYEALNLK